MQGMERIYTQYLFELLTLFPCVAIIGVRQCGKTTLLQQLPELWQIFDLEKASDYEILSKDPGVFLRLNPHHTAIDEAQLLPELFPALRVAIDADRGTPGRFVITGSSSPDLVRSISESLAGRVAIIEMAPFTYAEVCKEPVSGLVRLLSEKRKIEDFEGLQVPRDQLAHQHDYWLRGGFPEVWLKNSARFSQLWMNNYIQTYLERDVIRLFPGIARRRYRLFLQMLGNLSGSVINYSEVARALGVSQPTVREYFQIAHGTFLWRQIPAYERDAKKRIVKHPKGYLRDSGLHHFMLRLSTINDIMAHPAMGHSWEAMVIENILRELNALGVSFDYYHYRTGGGAEIDLILEGDFGLVPIEIKYGQKVSQRNLRGIKDFIAEYGCSYGLVVNNDERVRLYDDKLVGVPFGSKF
jgi:uncharacterized protein